MDLTVAERLALLNLLPGEGDIVTLRVMRELREALSFDEAEIARLGIEANEGRITWTDDGSTKDVEVGPKATRLVTDTLDKLNTDRKLTEQHLTLCDKFGIGD
jgi:hypothetical protein